jgi:hypothetical protein
VLLAGSGRSGTTWLAELLTRSNRFRYLFEPLHPSRTMPLGLPPRPYLRPAEAHTTLTETVEGMLTGRIRGRWVDQYNRKAVARRRLVKDVWANLTLGWVQARHPDTKIILVLRHPLAVAESQLATGWEWWTDPATLWSQPALVEDHLGPWRAVFDGLTDPLRRHVATWCVENAVPLCQLAPDNVYVACYEHLAAAPERELPPLFAFAGVRWDDRALAAVARPSSVARDGKASLEHASTELVRWTADTLAAFGLDRVYGEGPEPLVRDARALLARPARDRGPISTR